MRAEELTALGELTGRAVGGFAGRIRDLHHGIAQRTWQALRPGERVEASAWSKP